MIVRVNVTHSKAKKIKPCKDCGALRHAFTCSKRPNVIMRRKGLKKAGKISQKLSEQRKAYFEDNPSEFNTYYCYYCLYLGHEIPLPKEKLQVEHFHTKARHPELRFERSNLILSCAGHNKDKGHMDGEDYLRKLKGFILDVSN